MSVMQIKLAIIPAEEISRHASGTPLRLELSSTFEEMIERFDEPERDDFWASRPHDISGFRAFLLDCGLAARGEASEFGEEIIRDDHWNIEVELSTDYPLVRMQARAVDFTLMKKIMGFCETVNAKLVSFDSGLVLDNRLHSFIAILPFEDAIRVLEPGEQECG